MIMITGDTHGDSMKLSLRIMNMKEKLTSGDYLIIAGDFGFIWDKYSFYDLDMLACYDFTILFADGNHENHDMISEYPVEQWHGGRIHRIRDNIIHLMRGEIYEIEGHSFFTFGGAYSTDRIIRREGISYWSKELPCDKEYDNAINNLNKAGNKVDFIITHTAPASLVRIMGFTPEEKEKQLLAFLETLSQTCSFRHWYFGHFHIERCFANKFSALYENFEKVVVND